MKSQTLEKFSRELKKKRESNDITLQQIFNKTRIDVRYLEAIESADFEVMPDVYMRAFIKEYARAIDLDPENTLKQFEKAKAGVIDKEEPEVKEEPPKQEEKPAEETAGKDEEEPAPQSEPDTEPETEAAPEPEPEQEEKKKETIVVEAETIKPPKEYDETKESKPLGENGKSGNTQVYIWGGVAVIILAVVAYFLFIDTPENEIVTQTPSREQPAVQEPRYEVSEEEESSPPPALSDSLALLVTASDTAWIRVEIDNTRQEEFILYPNGSKELKGLTKFNLIIGNSGGVDLSLDGKELNFEGSEGRVRNVEVTQQGLQYVQTNPLRRNE